MRATLWVVWQKRKKYGDGVCRLDGTIVMICAVVS